MAKGRASKNSGPEDDTRKKPVVSGLDPVISQTDSSSINGRNDQIEVQEYGLGEQNAIAQRICELIEETPKGIEQICSGIPGLVNHRTFYKWLERSQALRHRYARAKERQAAFLVFEAMQIADTPRSGKKTKTDEKGIEVTEGDMIEHRRLQVDTRKWLAGKLDPKKWGDKIDVTSGNAPLKPTVIERVVVDKR